MTTVSIAGVGLIGGSFALALRKHGLAERVIGVSSPHTLAAALAGGVIDEGLPLEEAVPVSDVVYLAQPISRILDQLPQIARLARPSALVTDAGSTKAEIVARAAAVFPPGGAIFLGGHPMAGKAERGVEAAEAGLFDGSTYVLAPAGGVLPVDERIQRFCDWTAKLGARLMVMDPEVHDRTVAITSHLPQMASTALAAVVLDQLTNAESWRVAGGGLRDMTRLARSAYDLWRDICFTNTKNIDQVLAAYIQRLEHLRENLRQPGLKEEFRRAAKFAAEFQATQKSSPDAS